MGFAGLERVVQHLAFLTTPLVELGEAALVDWYAAGYQRVLNKDKWEKGFAGESAAHAGERLCENGGENAQNARLKRNICYSQPS